MTPRQLHAYMQLATGRLKQDSARLVALHAMAASGDLKAIKKFLRDAER